MAESNQFALKNPYGTTITAPRRLYWLTALRDSPKLDFC